MRAAGQEILEKKTINVNDALDAIRRGQLLLLVDVSLRLTPPDVSAKRLTGFHDFIFIYIQLEQFCVHF